MLPVNDNEEEEKQPPATHAVILLDISISTNSCIQTAAPATANLCNLTLEISQVWKV